MTKKVHNVLEEIVPPLVTVLLNSPDYQTFCKSDSCQNKIIAKTLNKVPPRYVISDEERQTVFELFNKRFMREILNRHIIIAIYEVDKEQPKKTT